MKWHVVYSQTDSAHPRRNVMVRCEGDDIAEALDAAGEGFADWLSGAEHDGELWEPTAVFEQQFARGLHGPAEKIGD